MNTTIKQIISTIENFAPLSLQESYDNAGIQVGESNTIVSGVLIVLDITENIIDEAIEKKCNMIIAHHPLIFKGVKSITGSSYIERCIIKAIQHNIVIYAGHTNVDSVANGVSSRIADKLQLKHCEFLKANVSKKDEMNSGLGMIGYLPKSMSEIDFLDILKENFHVKALKHSPWINKPIHKVAVCGGSGSSFIQSAISQKADVYVTGDIGYHQFFDHNNQILLVDIGHFESEQFTRNLFYDLLFTEYGIQFPMMISEKEQSPMMIY